MPRRPIAGDPVVAALLARCAFPRRGELHVGVSGGPDSTALLALAVAAVEGSGRGVTAHHVDHGVRPAGDAESEAVSVLADGWGAGFVAHRVDVAPGGNLEERLRTARRAALPPGTLLGHTADDQAETVVQRILRGTGPAGLAAMSTGTHPMLGLRRAEAAALCHHLGVSPLRDPTNDDPRFTRNRVRAEVLPLLDDVAGRDVVPLLARLAALAADQADALAALTADVDPCDARALAGAEPALAREALRAWWRDESGHPPPDAAALDRMMAVASGAARSCDVTAGWRLVRSAGRLALRGPGGAGDHPPAGR